MIKNNKKSLLRKIDEKFGFFHDERTEQNQLDGVRRSYFLGAAVFLLLAFFQQFTNGQVGIFWLILVAVIFSLLFLLIRRQQFGGGDVADERFNLLLSQSYRFAYFVLLLPIGAYAIYALASQVFVGNSLNSDGIFWWPLAGLITIIPIFITHIQRKSYPSYTWRILTMISFFIFVITYAIGYFIGSQSTP